MLAVPLLHRALSICACAAPSRLPLTACSDPDALPLVSIVCFLTHCVPESPDTGNEGLFIRLRSSLDRGLAASIPAWLCRLLCAEVSSGRSLFCWCRVFVALVLLPPPFGCPAQLHIRCGSVPVICPCLLSCLLSVPSAGSSCACALLGESHWNML